MKIEKVLLKGSITLLITFGLFNLFNFLFQLVMARMLSIEEYGILATLFAIIYILLIFTESIQTVLTKYTAKEDEKGKLKNILRKSTRKAFRISVLFFIIYLVIAIPLSAILKINYLLLSLNGLVMFLVFLLPVARGIMQGRKRFKALGFNMVLESSAKLIFGIIFVLLGWKVIGAVSGALIGGFLALAISFLPLRDIIKSDEQDSGTVGIYDYAKPTFFITTLVIIFYSIDVIIAKIFFSAEIAGAYAIASILAKTIFWGTLPISKAMFPLSADTSDKKGNLFTNAFLILSAGIIIALSVLYLIPSFVINIFSGKFIPEAIQIIFYLGIATSIISLTNLILLYKLSLGKVKGYAYLYIFLFIEILLLSFFSNNLIQFSIAFITASSAFLWGSVFLLKD